MPARPGPESAGEAPEMYGCDCCGEMFPRAEIAQVIAYGIETSACFGCRGERVLHLMRHRARAQESGQ